MEASNTGADITAGMEANRHGDKIKVGIHWLDATLNLGSPYMVLMIIGLDLFEGEEEKRKSPRQKGWNGYWSRLTTRFGDVFYDPNGRYPARLVMDGDACDAYLAAYGPQQFVCLLSVVELHNRHIHRIDPYVDDQSGLATLRKVQRHFARGAYRTYLRQFRDEGRPDAPDAPRTIYLGSAKSDMFIRIYDKRATESRRTLASVAGNPWTRYEMQARKSKAKAFTRELVRGQSLGETIAGVLGGCLTLTQPTRDTNRSRWPADTKWLKFLRGVEKIKLARPDRSKDIAPLDGRMKRVRRTVSAFVRQRGQEALRRELLAGDTELQPRHLKDIDPDKRPGSLDLNQVPERYGSENLVAPGRAEEDS